MNFHIHSKGNRSIFKSTPYSRGIKIDGLYKSLHVNLFGFIPFINEKVANDPRY